MFLCRREHTMRAEPALASSLRQPTGGQRGRLTKPQVTGYDGLWFLLYFNRRKDVSLFVLFWCSGVVGDILGDNSRFDVFDSRLRPSEFPFSPATGIDRQAVYFTDSFRGANNGHRRKIGEIPGSTGITGNEPEHYPMAEKPPSTGMAAPVTKSEAAEARKMAMPARSSGTPQRPAGVRASTRSCNPATCWRASRVSSVSIQPGNTALT
jgi:hypothetical protein